jgi:DNA-binding NarL/FixJ family response regulator
MSTPTCRVLIADDHPLMAEALRRVVDATGRATVAGVAASAGEAVAALERRGADVVVIDLAADDDAARVLDAAARARPRVRTLVLLADPEPAALGRLAGGADGVLTRRSSAEDVVRAIWVIHAGGTAIDPAVAAELLRAYRQDPNGTADRRAGGERAERALALAARGLTDAEIGRDLGVSRRTVQRLLASLRVQAGLRRRADLVRWASVERARSEAGRLTREPRGRPPAPAAWPDRHPA